MAKRLVIVGGGAAGMSAASAARRVDPDLDVVVLEAGSHAAYGLCGLPYFLANVVPEIDSLRAYPPEYFREARGIDLRFEADVLRLDPARQEVHFQSGDGLDVLTYDKLVLACGATPALPPVPGIDDDHVFTIRRVDESSRLRALLDAGHVGRATVVGAGYIGLEIAEALSSRGVEVTVVEALPRVMSNLDDVIAERVEAEVRRHVEVRLGTRLRALTRQETGIDVDLDGSTPVVADVVVIATGVRPGSALGATAGAATGPHGALMVDASMRTSIPNVYAAGDCVNVNHIVTGRPTFVPLGPAANKTGRVAGTVAAGGAAYFPGVVGTAVVKVFELSVGRTGLTLDEALAEGFDAHATDAVGRSRAKYYPRSAAVHVRLVHTVDGHLLGGQMVGTGDDVAKRIDVLAVSLHAGLGVSDLADLDLSYAPPFAPVYEPVQLAAFAARPSVRSAS